MATQELTSSQWFLLDWLSKEDFSALGECKGADLDALTEGGLAAVHWHPEEARRDWSGVSLTEAGWATLKNKE